MSLRGLLVLIGFLAAAVFVLVRVGTEPKKPETPSGDTPLLRAFTEDAVRAIDLACGANTVALERTSPRGWRIRKPLEADADPRKVHDLISALQDARVRKVVSEKAGDGAGFGLAPAACTVRLDLGAPGSALALKLGRSSPVSTERYAASEDGRVVLTDGTLYGTVARGADELREKRLVPAAADEMRRISVTRPDGRLVVVKIGDAWQVESPRRDLASTNACDNLKRAIAALETVEASNLPPPDDARPERRIKIEVMVQGPDRPKVAFVAAAGIDAKRLAWIEGARTAGLVEESKVEELLRPAESFYEKRVASFSLPDVLQVTLTQRGTTLQLARSGEAAPWTGTEGAAGFPVEGTRVIDFLNKVRSLTASGFEPAPGAPAAGAVAVTGAKGDLARLAFGPLGSPDALWVTTPARPGAIFRVEAAALAPIPTKADLAPKPPAAAATAP